ncbi:hypothetical protein [Streptomyces sp. JJ38]|uniref:hypothetical protein n=1 Tax=Streptomyces sp. JJ38 TaxID=2738128 RepID=UPI001C57C048|nr:hypothetical protein [Streptomyces sp. JJ38]MBW1596489.1 hypothetical protein [Streptomyces sp. JJ38]
MSPGADGYLCSALALPVATGHEIVLGRHRAWTPRLALRWLQGQAGRLADALDPVPGHGPFPAWVLRPVPTDAPDPGGVIRAWLRDHQRQSEQLASLRAGDHVSVIARDAELLYALCAQPIPAEVPRSRNSTALSTQARASAP